MIEAALLFVSWTLSTQKMSYIQWHALRLVLDLEQEFALARVVAAGEDDTDVSVVLQMGRYDVSLCLKC
jgi:hypothetical protein